MLQADCSSKDAERLVGLLEGLVAVPRFPLVIMSLSQKDKAALGDLWKSAIAVQRSSSSGAALASPALRSMYCL